MQIPRADRTTCPALSPSRNAGQIQPRAQFGYRSHATRRDATRRNATTPSMTPRDWQRFSVPLGVRLGQTCHGSSLIGPSGGGFS